MHAIVRAFESSNPPHRLLLGNDAYDIAMTKLDVLRKELIEWDAASRGVDYPKASLPKTA